jgi:hypothetical protein
MQFWRRIKSSKRNKTVLEVADLIERFLEGRSLYPQEWNDFIESAQRNETAEGYRKRCDALDPLVNVPGDPDPEAVKELRLMLTKLRQSHKASER